MESFFGSSFQKTHTHAFQDYHESWRCLADKDLLEFAKHRVAPSKADKKHDRWNSYSKADLLDMIAKSCCEGTRVPKGGAAKVNMKEPVPHLTDFAYNQSGGHPGHFDWCRPRDNSDPENAPGECRGAEKTGSDKYHWPPSFHCFPVKDAFKDGKSGIARRTELASVKDPTGNYAAYLHLIPHDQRSNSMQELEDAVQNAPANIMYVPTDLPLFLQALPEAVSLDSRLLLTMIQRGLTPAADRTSRFSLGSR